MLAMPMTQFLNPGEKPALVLNQLRLFPNWDAVAASSGGAVAASYPKCNLNRIL